MIRISSAQRNVRILCGTQVLAVACCGGANNRQRVAAGMLLVTLVTFWNGPEKIGRGLDSPRRRSAGTIRRGLCRHNELL